MPKHNTEIFFPYSVEKVYEMVKNIEEYPLFLPNCSHLTVLNRQKIDQNTQNEGEIEQILAEMGVKYSVFSEKFISKVQINQKQKRISVELNSGPLKNLSNDWKFIEHPKGCIALFTIQIEMKNFALRLALAAAFKIGVNEITEAFKKRADILYSN